MLYEIAHFVKERFGFLWDAIEWGNAEVFALMHHREMKRIPLLLAECSGRYQLRLATCEDVEQMKAFFEAQPEESFTFDTIGHMADTACDLHLAHHRQQRCRSTVLPGATYSKSVRWCTRSIQGKVK